MITFPQDLMLDECWVIIFGSRGDHPQYLPDEFAAKSERGERIRGKGAGSTFGIQVLVGCSKKAQDREGPKAKNKK